MSGFIGYYELFLKLELALDIKFRTKRKKSYQTKIKTFKRKECF